MEKEERELLVYLSNAVQITMPGLLEIVALLVNHLDDEVLTEAVYSKIGVMELATANMQEERG